MSLIKRFDKVLQRSECLPEGSRVLVALSGGADSVALLVLLRHVAPGLRLTLEAAHLDHGLRQDSAADAAFVERLCARFNLPLTMERADVAELARQSKGNLEEVARDVRRRFLLRVAKQRNCDRIAMGHHADDQAETFLLRLLRGSGSTGLAGMRTVNGKIVRPLLAFQRHELVAHLEQEGVPWQQDPSNSDTRFARNRIRHELIPLLESFNPQIRDQLAGSCEQFGHDEDFWSSLVAEEFDRCCQRDGARLTLDRIAVMSRPTALASRLVRAALREIRGDLRRITANHIASILQLINDGPVQGELSLPGAWVARRYDRVLICRNKPETPEYWEVALTQEGTCLLPNGCTIELSMATLPCGESTECVEFSARDVTLPLVLRSPLPGDRFRPSGMKGTKKLQDLFVDLKLPREARQNTVVLVKGTELLWVVGVRRCEGWRPVAGEEVLRVAIRG